MYHFEPIFEVKYGLHKKNLLVLHNSQRQSMHAMIAAAISRVAPNATFVPTTDRTSERDSHVDSHGEQSPKRAAPLAQSASRTRSCNTRRIRDPLTMRIVRSPFDGRSVTRVRSGKPPPCIRRTQAAVQFFARASPGVSRLARRASDPTQLPLHPHPFLRSQTRKSPRQTPALPSTTRRPLRNYLHA